MLFSKIDFTLETLFHNDKLLFIDLSEYAVRPKNGILEVYSPNSSQVNSMQINLFDVNIISTATLGLSQSCTPFSDGIYSFRYSVAPNDKVFKCKDLLINPNQKLAIKKLIDELGACDKNLDKKKVDRIFELSLMRDSIQGLLEKNRSQAVEVFNYLNRELKIIGSCDL